MYYVYILKNNKSNIYIGFNNNLKKRMKDHEDGLVSSTKNKGPYKLVYYETYKSKQDAVLREKRLKYHGKALAQLKRRLEHSLRDT